MLQKNEAVLLNEIIEKIYTMPDCREMRATVLEMLETLIPFDSATFYLASKEKDKGHHLTDPVGKGIPQTELQRYIDDYEDQDYTRWLFMNGKAMVYRETDIYSDKIRSDNMFYKDIYLPAKIYYSAQMSIARKEVFLGIITLYRNKEQGDFTDDEMFLLDLLKDHLNNRLGFEEERELGCLPVREGKNRFDATEFMKKYSLTSREVEVMGLVAAGIQGSEICKNLAISPNTLKKHMLNIYKKLGINSRWELVGMLLDHR